MLVQVFVRKLPINIYVFQVWMLSDTFICLAIPFELSSCILNVCVQHLLSLNVGSGSVCQDVESWCEPAETDIEVDLFPLVWITGIWQVTNPGKPCGQDTSSKVSRSRYWLEYLALFIAIQKQTILQKYVFTFPKIAWSGSVGFEKATWVRFLYHFYYMFACNL